MFKFDREKFFDSYREKFGPLHQSLVDALNNLLNQIEQDGRFDDTTEPRTGRRQLAYCLATFKWETAHTMRPIDEFGSEKRGQRTLLGRMMLSFAYTWPNEG